MISRQLGGLLFCSALACGGDATRATLSDLRQLVLTEEIRVGDSDDPNRGLSSVSALDVADDRTMYIVDGTEGHVRVFSATGSLVTTIGRKGQGPGELARPDGIGILGDSVWVSDPGNRRITFFGRDGRLISSIPAPAATIGTSEPSVHVRAALPRRDHTVISQAGTGTYQVNGPSDSLRVPRLRFDTMGVVMDTLSSSVVHHLNAKLVQFGSETATLLRPLQFPAFPIEAECDTVRVIVEQRPDAGSLVIRRVDDRDKDLWRREYNYSPQRVSADRIKARVSTLARSFFAKDSIVPAGAEDAMRAALTFPEFMPLVGGVNIGRDGTIWMRRADGDEGAPSRWIVVAAGGDVQGEVTPPKNAMWMPVVVSADRVWLPVSDESGFLSIRAYLLSAPRQ